MANNAICVKNAIIVLLLAIKTKQLQSLTSEIYRVIKASGLHIYSARNTADKDYAQGLHHGENIYETRGYAVHFFSKQMIEELAQGFAIESIGEFQEGALPRTLFLVSARKI